MNTFKQLKAQVQDSLVSSRPLDRNGNVEDEWSSVNESVTLAAADSLGLWRFRQPDWCLLIVNRHWSPWFIWRTFVISGCCQRILLVIVRHFARPTIQLLKLFDRPRDMRIMSVAEEAEEARRMDEFAGSIFKQGSRKRWGPVTMSVVLDKHGNLIDYVDVPCVRAARQFQGILNIPSHFNPFAINDEPSHEDWGHLDLDHIFWELKSAILRMRRGTALCYQASCQVVSPVAERLYFAVYTHWWSTFGRYRMFQMIGTTLRSSLRSVIFILPPLSKTSLRVCCAFDWCPSNQFTTPQESDCQYGEY